MRSLIVCVSVSNGNTRRVAGVLAGELGGTVVEPEDVVPSTLGDYDLVGFGSGIYGMAFHRRLLGLVRRLPEGHGRSSFVFATSGTLSSTLAPRVMMLGRSPIQHPEGGGGHARSGCYLSIGRHQ